MTTTLHERPTLLVPEIHDEVTRREFVVGGVVLVGLFATGCGDDGAGANDDRAPTDDTLRVENTYGSFAVPVEPKRVVVLEGRRDLEVAFALGLTPIAIGSNALVDGALAPFLPVTLENYAVIENAEINLETLAALRPDLIIGRDVNIVDVAGELAAIAPLVPVASDGPWRPDLEQTAAALGRDEQLREVLAAYDELRAEIRARHAEAIAGSVIAVVQYEAGVMNASRTSGFYLQANTLADLGGTHLGFLESLVTDDSIGEFSLEQLEMLDGADAILLIINSSAERAEIEANSLWQRISAVAGGRVVVTDFRTNYGSVFAATECLRLLDDTYATLT